mgnify:CR=1 FL=1
MESSTDHQFYPLYPQAMLTPGRRKVVRLVSLDRYESEYSIELEPLREGLEGNEALASHFDFHVHRFVKDYARVGHPGTIHGLDLGELEASLEPGSTDVVILTNIWNTDLLRVLSQALKQANPKLTVIVAERRRNRPDTPKLAEMPFADYHLSSVDLASFSTVLQGLLEGDLSRVELFSWRLKDDLVVRSDIGSAEVEALRSENWLADLRAWRKEDRSSGKMLSRFIKGSWSVIRSISQVLSEEYDFLAERINARLRRERYVDLKLPFLLLGPVFAMSWSSRVTAALGRLFENEYFPGYIAGKTRETYYLWRAVELGQVVEVEEDGFYMGGERVSGTPKLSAFIRSRGVTSVTINEYFSPLYFYSDSRFLVPVVVVQLAIVMSFAYRVGPFIQPSAGWILWLTPWNAWLFVVPFYVALLGWTRERDEFITLWQVDQVDVDIQAEVVPKGHFTVVFNPNIIFCGSRSYNGLFMHEKAHVAYGASESAAWTIQTAQFTRGLLTLSVMDMNVVGRVTEKLDLLVGLAITVVRTLIFNIAAVAYLFGFKRNWFEPTEQRFRHATMDVSGHLDYLVSEGVSHAYCSSNGVKWYDDLFVIARVQAADDVAYRIAHVLVNEPIIQKVFSVYERQFLRASLFYEIGVVCENLGKLHEAERFYMAVIDVGEGLATFPAGKRILGYLLGLLQPDNETIVQTFCRLARGRMALMRGNQR